MHGNNSLADRCDRTARTCGKARLHRGAFLAVSLFSAITLAPPALAGPDLKIVAKTIDPRESRLNSEKTTYFQSDRRRVEEHHQIPVSFRPGGPTEFLPAPAIVTITRCDLDQMFVLNLDDREYTSTPLPKYPSKEALLARAAEQARTAPQTQPTLLIESTTNDTGERKQMLGFTARHVIITRKQIPLGDSGTIPQETVTDGWYTDLDAAISCDRATGGHFAILTASSSKPGERLRLPVFTFKNIGDPEKGFALETKDIQRDDSSSPDGLAHTMESLSNEMQVTELSKESLDPALFEVPKNFRKVSQIRGLPATSYWTQALEWLDYYWDRLSRAL